MDTKLRTGVAYYPEHWDEADWPEQARRMKEIGFTTARLAEFAWAVIEREEGRFDFAWLDRAIDVLGQAGIETILGTPTAAPPQWMTRKYPDIRLMDVRGVRLPHGGRRHVCVRSATFRRLTERVVRAMGRHYAKNKNVIAFQTDNELSCHVSACYCPECQAAFREFLRRRFGTIEKLREEWDANFWSVRPESFDDLPPEDWFLWESMQHPALKYEFRRFTSESWCSYHAFQREILHTEAPGKPVFHNMMGLDAGFDHFQMARDSEFVGVDIYPNASGRDDSTGNPIYNPVRLSLVHHVTRSLKRHVPYHVVESPLAAVNWWHVNQLPRPGQGEMWGHMALSHGADSYLTFRWQAVRSGGEKHHSAVLMHDLRMDGPNVPIARHIAATAQALSDALAGTLVKSRVAFAHCYENLWHLETAPSQRVRDYWRLWMPWCEALFSRNVSYDVVDLNTEAALGEYDLVILPYQQNLSDEMAARLRAYVSGGGTLMGTFMTGWADEFARMRTEPQPAPLADLFGILVQTHDPLDESRTNAVRLSGGAKAGAKVKALESTLWCDLVELRGAKKVGAYTKDFYAGSPAVTVNKVGRGRAWYVATQPGEELAGAIMDRLCREAGVPTYHLPLRVQVLTRTAADGRQVDYYLNHSDRTVSFKPLRRGKLLLGRGGVGKKQPARLTLPPYGAEVVEVDHS